MTSTPTVPGDRRSNAGWPRLPRRSFLALWGAALARAYVSPAASDAPSAFFALDAPAAAAEGDRATVLSIDADAVRMRPRFDPRVGQFSIASLSAQDRAWVPDTAPASGALWIEQVQVDDGPLATIDGGAGLELASSTRSAMTLIDSASRLRLNLEFLAGRGGAVTHRLSLTNGRDAGLIRVGSAFTLSLPLWTGAWTEVLKTDDAPNGWELQRHELPVYYGYQGLRSADGGIYPLIRLGADEDAGLIVAVDTATAWRIEIGLEDDRRILRAGEFRSDLELAPGQTARLPDVVTIFYRGGPDGATEALRAYLESVRLPAPNGWRNVPPAIFNTWFGYGCNMVDEGAKDTPLRVAARQAADAGVEVLVVDAGWYLGNPVPDESGGRRGRKDRSRDEQSHENQKPDESEHDLLFQGSVDDFNIGLGTWIENPAKWLGKGSRGSGLRGFSDYVHSLDVRAADGRGSGKMKLGLWFEPDRFDPDLSDPARVPPDWALPGAPILDLSRAEVVQGVTERLQNAIENYRVDYIKIDANFVLDADPAVGRSGHFWTLWSDGFVQLLTNLRRANPGLYIEHCAGGLKRYWIGMGRVAHSTWLDDDVNVDNVGRLLDATDALMLPAQKTVLVTEDLARFLTPPSDDDEDPGGQAADSEIESLVRTYWGDDHLNGGALGFSSRLEQLSPDQERQLTAAVDAWKRDAR